MNTNILKKCVEELQKENPKIDYVLGMLESVIELSAVTPVTNRGYGISSTMTPTITSGSGLVDLDKVDEVLESYVTTPGPVANLR